MYIGKKIKEIKKYYIKTFFLLMLVFFCGNFANAATLQISSDSSTLVQGEKTTLYVLLNSEGVAVNNAESTISFSNDLVEIVSVNKTGSIFSLWVEEPTFSNSTGIITFNGGVPTPGFSGSKGTVLSITLRAKKIGEATFSFSGAAVRANDGLGTDVLNGQLKKTITIVEKNIIETAPVTPDSTISRESILNDLLLAVFSPTHPDQNQWSRDKNPLLKWNIPSGVDTIQTSIDENDSAIPRVVYRPAIGEKLIKDWKEGVSYFKVRARKNGIWGPTSSYILRIDNTAPIKKEVVFTYDDETKLLNISADVQDVVSGIDHYEIFVNDKLVKNVPAKEFINGKYALNVYNPGNNSVKLVVVDRAGNSVEALDTFSVTSISVPELDPIKSIVSANENLLISGKIKNSDNEVFVNIKSGSNETVVIKTKSNSDKTFAVVVQKIKPGKYEIWAEIGSVDKKVSSVHLYTKAVSQLIVKIGSFAINGVYLMVLIALVFIVLSSFAYYFGYRRSKIKDRLNITLVKGDSNRALSVLRERLERHLEILQQTRHLRILTEQEKEIKEAIEDDLDEVDRLIEETKKVE